MIRRAPRRWLPGLAAAAFVAGACTASEVAPLPPPPPVPETTTTTVVDYAAIALPEVPGRTTTTLAVGPGRAGLAGTVTGPEGPVAGAVVHVERLVGEARATMDMTTGPDGGYALPGVLGGRYRVRGWKQAPDNLALIEPEVFFLEGSEQRVLDLGLTRYQGLAVTSALAPDPPVVGQPANLVVQVVDQRVDGTGLVQATPMPATSVLLSASGDWRILSPNPGATDGSGRARWQIECRRVGPQPMSAVVAGTVGVVLELADCGAPPLPPDPSSTTRPATSTTRPGTATTRPGTATTARPRPSTTTTRR